jgi:hypothetical protein
MFYSGDEVFMTVQGRLGFWILGAVLALGSCGLWDYGQIGGADKTDILAPGNPGYEGVLDPLRGVWYSHYAGIGRLDGYRIGKMGDFGELMEESGKLSLFPELARPLRTYGGGVFNDEDYFLFYDDTVYGQGDDGSPPRESWGFGYLGIIRRVNTFNGDPKRGAIIVEYLEGCAPRWLDRWPESAGGALPFFGIYYRELGRDTVQMANAVDLAALYAGEPYFTEKASLEEALGANTVENEAEFISWGVVIPQDREP